MGVESDPEPTERTEPKVEPGKAQDDTEGSTGSTGSASADTEGEAEDSEVVETPATLIELAEKAGIKPDQLYDMKIKLSNGESMKLGEFKDQAQQWESERAAVEEKRQAYENERLKERDELRALLSQVGTNLTPEVVKQAEKQHRDYIEGEWRATLDAIPDWADESQLKADKADLVEYIKDYGFSAAELDFVHDHRLMKLLRDNMRLKKRMKAATATKKKVRAVPKGSKPSAPTGAVDTAAGIIEAGKSAVTPEEKSAYISKLLGG